MKNPISGCRQSDPRGENRTLRKMKRLKTFVACESLLLLLSLTLPCTATPLQVADAVLEIVVVDDSGAALPEVMITIIQPETGLQRTALTDNLGQSRTIALPPGGYDVRLEHPGFKTTLEKGLSLRIGQVSRFSVKLSV